MPVFATPHSHLSCLWILIIKVLMIILGGQQLLKNINVASEVAPEHVAFRQLRRAGASSVQIIENQAVIGAENQGLNSV